MTASLDGHHDSLVAQLAQLPADRAVRVCGADADMIATALAMSRTLPAGLVHRVRRPARQANVVHDLLNDLEEAAIGLFPAWLPEAVQITSPGGAGLVTARALAAARAGRTGRVASFLAELAATALSGMPGTRHRFAPEVRASELAYLLADALGRRRLVVLLPLPQGLHSEDEQALAAACDWFANRGRCGVWLTGAELANVDWLPTVSVTVQAAGEAVSRGAAWFAADAGLPHPRSTAEATLEAALARRAWAVGRRWNQTYQSHALRNPVRLDLLWSHERCVVEVDGPEHCDPVRFDDDRRRDVHLQLDGYAVLRFTNARVLHDVEVVVQQIGQFLEARRSDLRKGIETWPATN